MQFSIHINMINDCIKKPAACSSTPDARKTSQHTSAFIFNTIHNTTTS